MVSGLVMPLVAWCIEKKGPLYVTVFSPIRLVIVALVGSFALEETLYLGRYTKLMILCMVYVICECHSVLIFQNLQFNWCNNNGGRSIPSGVV